MPAVLQSSRHLQKEPISKDVEQIISSIASNLVDEDFVSFSKDIQYSVKQSLLKDAELLLQKLGSILPEASGLAVFRLMGAGPVPFRCSTGPAILIPIKNEGLSEGNGVSLEVGTVLSLTEPVLIKSPTDFVVVFLSKKR